MEDDRLVNTLIEQHNLEKDYVVENVLTPFIFPWLY